MDVKKIKVGSRSSPLALVQVEEVVSLLKDQGKEFCGYWRIP